MRAFGTRARLGLKTVGHNLPFDLWFAAKEGVIICGDLEDTMLNEVLINDDLRDYDLDASARRRGVPAKAVGRAVRHPEGALQGQGRTPAASRCSTSTSSPATTPWRSSMPPATAISTYELWKAQQPLLDADGLRRVHALECALLPLHRGDAPARHPGRPRLRQAGASRESIASSTRSLMVMPPGFEANKTAQCPRLPRKPRLPQLPEDRAGKDSFREDWLELNCGDAGANVVRDPQAAQDEAAPSSTRSSTTHTRERPYLSRTGAVHQRRVRHPRRAASRAACPICRLSRSATRSSARSCGRS